MKKIKDSPKIVVGDYLITVNRGRNLDSIFESFTIVRAVSEDGKAVIVSSIADFEPDTWDGPKVTFRYDQRGISIDLFDAVVTKYELYEMLFIEDRWCEMVKNFRGLYPLIITNGVIDSSVNSLMNIKKDIITPLI